MAFICKLLGCGGSKDEVKSQSQAPVVELHLQGRGNDQMKNERAAFVSSSDTEKAQTKKRDVGDRQGGEEKQSLLSQNVVVDKAVAPESTKTEIVQAARRDVEEDSGKDEVPPQTTSPKIESPQKKKTKVESIRLPENDETEAGSAPARLKSPALPAAWQMIAMQDDGGDGQGVDLEVFGENGEDALQVLEDPENDDADDPESGTFGDAWRSFKAQDETGLKALRDYVGNNYVMLLRKMLSPEREHFATAALGPDTFDFRGRRLRRDDFSVHNERGHLIQCSLWRDRPQENATAPAAANMPEENSTDTQHNNTPTQDGPLRNFRRSLRGLVSGVLGRRARSYCVLYVHDVGGSRLGSLSSLGVALDAGAAGYCALDTSGCGRSEGRNVSFGFFERYDIAAVCSYLVSEAHFTDVVLWGRGAGAVACVLYAAGIDKPLPVPQSYLDGAYDSVFGSTPAAPQQSNAPPIDTNGHNQHPQQHHTQQRASKLPRLSHSGWPYEARSEFSVDALSNLDNRASANDEEQRVKTVHRFSASLHIEPETSMWVVSQPPLIVTSVTQNGEAAALGIKVGDLLTGLGTSARLPHSANEFNDMLERLARKPRATLMLHFKRGVLPSSTAPRTTLDAAQQRRLEPLVRPAGLVLDCVVDSPTSLVSAFRDNAAQREPLLVNLLDPLLSSALDVLFHSVEKRANFAPTAIDLKLAAKNIEVPALFGVNDFHDVDRGIPNLAGLSKAVYEAYAASITPPQEKETNPSEVTPPPMKQIIKYNAPLRLALRGSLDAMSSKFLNKSYVFLQRLPGLRDHAATQRAAYFAQAGASAPPRWVVTTRPWAQQETESFLDEYESAQSAVDVVT